MNLDLSDEETAALLRELDGIIDNDRNFLSPRIRDIDGDLRQAPAAVGARAPTAAQALRVAPRGPPAPGVNPNRVRR
jgi:hypothetical protein